MIAASIGPQPHRPFRRVPLILARYGFLAALAALVVQLALGSMVPPDDAATSQLAALDAVSILCAGRHATDPAGQAPHRRHAADLALCPLGSALALPGCILPAATPLPPARCRAVDGGSRERPPGRGPPPATARVGAPRAPPVTA